MKSKSQKFCNNYESDLTDPIKVSSTCLTNLVILAPRPPCPRPRGSSHNSYRLEMCQRRPPTFLKKTVVGTKFLSEANPLNSLNSIKGSQNRKRKRKRKRKTNRDILRSSVNRICKEISRSCFNDYTRVYSMIDTITGVGIRSFCVCAVQLVFR